MRDLMSAAYDGIVVHLDRSAAWEVRCQQGS
jgi:hypothetical protein